MPKQQTLFPENALTTIEAISTPIIQANKHEPYYKTDAVRYHMHG
jgi:hypothetical protein